LGRETKSVRVKAMQLFYTDILHPQAGGAAAEK
jgi:hypothetical protein